MMDMIKHSKSEGHNKNIQCDQSKQYNNTELLSEPSQSSVSEESPTDVSDLNYHDTSEINIKELLPSSISLNQLLKVRTDLDTYIKNKRVNKSYAK